MTGPVDTSGMNDIGKVIAVVLLLILLYVLVEVVQMVRRSNARTAARRQAEFDALPVPACGDKKTHHFWQEQGWACPLCRGNAYAKMRQEQQERERQALAKAVVVEMQRQGLVVERDDGR